MQQQLEQERRLRRGKRIVVNSDEQGPQNIPIRYVRASAYSGPAKESLLPHRLALAESEVYDLDSVTYRLIAHGNLEGARPAAEKALSVALSKLTVDHWLLARLLNKLAYLELCEGENVSALSRIETAQAI